MKQTSNTTFHADVLDQSLPTLAYFGAAWCGPCKMLAPILEALEPQFVGRVNFVKVDVDDCNEIAMRYAVRGVPTMKMFVGGAVMSTKVGALLRPDVEKFINQHLE
jgi:thioredoxin 1